MAGADTSGGGMGIDGIRVSGEVQCVSAGTEYGLSQWYWIALYCFGDVKALVFSSGMGPAVPGCGGIVTWHFFVMVGEK
eukprot:8329204-Ditylum_brightwellii.AAC.1